MWGHVQPYAESLLVAGLVLEQQRASRIKSFSHRNSSQAIDSGAQNK